MIDSMFWSFIFSFVTFYPFSCIHSFVMLFLNVTYPHNIFKLACQRSIFIRVIVATSHGLYSHVHIVSSTHIFLKCYHGKSNPPSSAVWLEISSLLARVTPDWYLNDYAQSYVLLNTRAHFERGTKPSHGGYLRGEQEDEMR